MGNQCSYVCEKERTSREENMTSTDSTKVLDSSLFRNSNSAAQTKSDKSFDDIEKEVDNFNDKRKEKIHRKKVPAKDKYPSQEKLGIVIREEEKNEKSAVPQIPLKEKFKLKKTYCDLKPINENNQLKCVPEPKRYHSLSKFKGKHLDLLIRLQRFRRFMAENPFFYFTLEAKIVQKKNKLNLFFTSQFYNSISRTKPYNLNGYLLFYHKDLDKNVIERQVRPLDLTSTKRNLRIFDHNFVYIGEVNDFLEPDGYGVKLHSSGDIFKGIWRCGDLSGWVRLVKVNRCIEGFYFEGSINSKGTIYSDSDVIYTGNIVNNEKSGEGKEVGKEYEYEGNYVAGKKHGKGRIKFFANNEEYQGDFNDDQIHGFGTYYFKNNSTYTGTFVLGKMQGKGVFKWEDGSEYIGDYVENIKEGKGKFKWKNGRIFEGPFVNGKMHGKGKLTYKNNTFDVEFSDGHLIKNNDSKQINLKNLLCDSPRKQKP